MKLERFNKNKKQKQIIIGSIIAIVLIIGGISLIASFAMYEEKQTFDVLKGTVPDFSGADITLAFTVDKEKGSGSFPNRNSGYIVQEVKCEEDVTADWDNWNWSLENIRNPKNANKIKCNVDFTEVYTEKELNGAYPALSKGLVPVEIGNNGKVTKADIMNDWYSYKDKRWANAVILANGKEDTYEAGATINETDIESYFVWIPKYRYKLFDENLGKYPTLTSAEKKEQIIQIEFGLDNTTDNDYECRTPMNDDGTLGLSGVDGQCVVGKWMTHPAFLAFDTNGFWVGKFETGEKGTAKAGATQRTTYNANDLNKMIIKPNQYAWTNSNILTMYQLSYNYKRTLDSHMMKNTEWGAVAYLSHSIYGTCDDNTCTEVRINNNSNYVTGYAAIAAPTTAYDAFSDYESKNPNQDGTRTLNYTNEKSTMASTTGNYSGIYDMSGGAWEHVMGAATTKADITQVTLNDIHFEYSGMKVTDIASLKYIDLYLLENGWANRILGDATGEMGPFAQKTYSGSHAAPRVISSWYEDNIGYVVSSYFWEMRGGEYTGGVGSGVFALSSYNYDGGVRQFGVLYRVGWKTNMVRSSKPPLVSLGAGVVRRGLSVGKRECEP